VTIAQDPRHRNEVFDRSSVTAYLHDYADRLKSALVGVDAKMVEKGRMLIEQASLDGHRIFAIGNGGSAAIADHLCCDLTKGTHAPGHPIVDSTSLVANVALYSAVANDFGFENVFAKQLSFVGKEGDLLIAVSSSGNSPNIIVAVETAHTLGMHTIGLSGFDGGRLREIADAAIHVDAANYGVVEDAHQAIMHVLAQYIAFGRDAGAAA
jgi:D-sedoheptulose 7-phosphate isomerase